MPFTMTDVTGFPKGSRVRVEFEGEVLGHEGAFVLRVRCPDGSVQKANVDHATKLTPAYWPPQVGDVWEAGGFEYMIRDSRNASRSALRGMSDLLPPYMLVSPLDADAPTLRGRLDELQAANPKLIRRRGGFHA